MALLQVGQLRYFDTSASYEELYAVTAESKDYIDTWTFKTHYDYIRKILDAKSQMEIIEVCQICRAGRRLQFIENLIGKKRMKALPFARYCVHCQTSSENNRG